MMQEKAPNRRAAVKKKPKLSAAKTAMEKIGFGKKCPAEQKLQPTPASVLRNVQVVTPKKKKTKTDENLPVQLLPQNVITIHRGRIVSPSAITSASWSSVKKHNAEYNRSGTVDSRDGQATDSGTQRTQKSDRHKRQTVAKPTGMVFGSKSDPKIASQSTSSKVLAERNSNAAYFDSSQLQDSGNIDKLSLDCSVKLYGQLGQPPRGSQPLQSSEHSSTSKSRHNTSSDRTARSSDPKIRSFDQTKQTSCVAERVPKMQAASTSGNSVKVSDWRLPSCTVQLNRIESLNDFGSSLRHQGDSSVQLRSSTAKRSGRERQYGGNGYEFGARGDDTVADAGCYVTLTPPSHGAIQQSDVPATIENVPRSPVSLSKPRRTFSKRSHTTTDRDSSTSGLPKKSRLPEVASRSNSSEKSHASLASPSSSSVNDKCGTAAVKQSDTVSSEVDMTRVHSAVDDDSYEVPNAVVDCVKIRNSKSSALESADGSVSDVKCGIGSETSAGAKRCHGDDSSSSHRVSKSKKSRMFRPSSEASVPMSADSLASDAVDEASDGNPARCSLSPTSPRDAYATAESNSASPLHLRIQRLADVTPILQRDWTRRWRNE